MFILFGWRHPSIAGDVNCDSAVSPAADPATTAGSDDALHAADQGTYVAADDDPSDGSDASYAAPAAAAAAAAAAAGHNTSAVGPAPVAGAPLLYHPHSSSQPCA